MTKIAIVEDDLALQTILQYNLVKEGYEIVSITDGKTALNKITETLPDCILLDWMLPHLSGIEICKQIRQNHNLRYLPVLMLTARGDETDKVSALSIGADDYMTKPFSIPELMARIKALLRRIPTKSTQEIRTFGDLCLDDSKKQVFRQNKELHLGPTEFRLLKFLMTNPEKVFTRDELLKGVWGTSIHVEGRTVDVHIKRLRQSLNKGFQQDAIRTIRSSGYALVKTTEK